MGFHLDYSSFGLHLDARNSTQSDKPVLAQILAWFGITIFLHSGPGQTCPDKIHNWKVSCAVRRGDPLTSSTFNADPETMDLLAQSVWLELVASTRNNESNHPAACASRTALFAAKLH